MLLICKHPRIHISDITDEEVFYEMLMCQTCGCEIARWKKPHEGGFCFEKEMYRRQFVFGQPFKYNLSTLAALR